MVEIFDILIIPSFKEASNCNPYLVIIPLILFSNSSFVMFLLDSKACLKSFKAISLLGKSIAVKTSAKLLKFSLTNEFGAVVSGFVFNNLNFFIFRS